MDKVTNNVLEYKGYLSKVVYDVDTKKICGLKIDGINECVEFSCEKNDSIEDAFHKAVDQVLEGKDRNNMLDQEPRKITIELSSNEFRNLAILAAKKDKPLEKVLKQIIIGELM